MVEAELVLTIDDLPSILRLANVEGVAGKELKDAALRLIFRGDREGWENTRRKWRVVDNSSATIGESHE